MGLFSRCFGYQVCALVVPASVLQRLPPPPDNVPQPEETNKTVNLLMPSLTRRRSHPHPRTPTHARTNQPREKSFIFWSLFVLGTTERVMDIHPSTRPPFLLPLQIFIIKFCVLFVWLMPLCSHAAFIITILLTRSRVMTHEYKSCLVWFVVGKCIVFMMVGWLVCSTRKPETV